MEPLAEGRALLSGPQQALPSQAQQRPSCSSSRRPALWHGRRGAVLAAAACAAVGLVVAGPWASRQGWRAASRVSRASWSDELIVEAADAKEAEVMKSTEMTRICDEYPHMKFTKCLHNNLGGQGPDAGEEGLVFESTNQWTGNKMELVLNAMSGYKPFSTLNNGMSGEYGILNIDAGTSTQLKFSLRHARTKEPIKEPTFALTFFDLDQGRNNKTRESITAKGFRSFSLSDDVLKGAVSEIEVTRNPDGSRTFMSTTFGTGMDNPKNPLKLNMQQNNRAVSFRYRDFSESVVTVAASAGPEARFFTFVAYPALFCASEFLLGHSPHLPNLKYTPPNEVPVQADRNAIFEEWFVEPGQKVKKGDKLFSTTEMDADDKIKVVRAQTAGTVEAIQGKLQKDDLLSLRLDDKTLVVIKQRDLQPLGAGPDDVRTVAPAHSTLKRFLVHPGDAVRRGDPIAEVQTADGQVEILTAGRDGIVNDTQSALKPGDPIDAVEDRNVATISHFPKLSRASNNTAVAAPQGSIFVEYLVDVGDKVEVGAPLAKVRDATGAEKWVEATRSGRVVSRQEKLLTGMHLDTALTEDRNIVLVGEENRFPPLEVNARSSASNVPAGSEFVKWRVARYDFVNAGDPICDVKTRDGVTTAVKASSAGVVLARQEGLRPGMRVEDVMQDRNVATVGPLPALHAHDGEGMTNASGQDTFDRYLVKPGDVVQENQTVAIVRDADGNIKEIKASKYGTVVSLQEHLRKGDPLGKSVVDSDILVVGKFPPVQASGLREQAVSAPQNAIFNKWYVKDGDHVEVGQPLAQVILPVRQLESGTGSPGAGEPMDIPAPIWGKISNRQPLKEGEPISEQQEGGTIATIDQGPPWWLALLSILGIIFCCLCCLHSVMKKPPRPITTYTPMPDEPKPNGLRLDFQNRAKIVTVYAKRRPLGIKHNFIAPIVAHEFTINSYARKELKVKQDWKLVRIGDEELNENPDFHEVNDKLTQHMKDLRIWPLPIEFRPTHGAAEVKRLEFTERPIGVEFTNRAPVVVSKVHPGSPAHAAMVQEGWCVTRIGDADVDKNTNFREVMAFLKEGVDALDDSGKDYEMPI